MDIKKKTTKELTDLVLELHDSIYTAECFGSRDVLIYSLALRELEARGVKVREKSSLEVS